MLTIQLKAVKANQNPNINLLRQCSSHAYLYINVYYEIINTKIHLLDKTSTDNITKQSTSSIT